MTMLQLAGPTAETAFRLAKLCERLREQVPAIRGVDTRFVHFVHLERELDPDERRVLDALLAYGEPRTAPAAVETGGSAIAEQGAPSEWIEVE